MSMKTPEQIAAEMLDTHFRGVRTDIQDFGLTAWMVRAIEADRAQRAEVTPAELAEAVCDAMPHLGGGSQLVYEDALEAARKALMGRIS